MIFEDEKHQYLINFNSVFRILVILSLQQYRRIKSVSKTTSLGKFLDL